MVIKFNNGYTVKVTDTGDAKREDIIEAAKKLVAEAEQKKLADAVALTKEPVTNVSFQITKLKEAAKKGDEQAFNRELMYLKRDLAADLTHANYKDTYSKGLLQKILNAYEGAFAIVSDFEEPNPETGELEEASKILNMINLIRKQWELDTKTGPTVITEDATAPYYDPDEAPRIESSYSPVRLKKEARHYAEEAVNLEELDEVMAELDELISKGRAALTEAGWTKDDARRAISERYDGIIADLKKGGAKIQAHMLSKKVDKLKSVWGLEYKR